MQELTENEKALFNKSIKTGFIIFISFILVLILVCFFLISNTELSVGIFFASIIGLFWGLWGYSYAIFNSVKDPSAKWARMRVLRVDVMFATNIVVTIFGALLIYGVINSSYS